MRIINFKNFIILLCLLKMNTKSSGKFTKFPKKFETSYVFSDTINRVFTNLSEKQNIEMMTKKTQLPYLFTYKPYPI